MREVASGQLRRMRRVGNKTTVYMVISRCLEYVTHSDNPIRSKWGKKTEYSQVEKKKWWKVMLFADEHSEWKYLHHRDHPYADMAESGIKCDELISEVL